MAVRCECTLWMGGYARKKKNFQRNTNKKRNGKDRIRSGLSRAEFLVIEFPAVFRLQSTFDTGSATNVILDQTAVQSAIFLPYFFFLCFSKGRLSTVLPMEMVNSKKQGIKNRETPKEK